MKHYWSVKDDLSSLKCKLTTLDIVLQTLFKKSKETTDLIPSSSKGTPKKKPLKDDDDDDEDNGNNNEGDDSGTDINSDDDTEKSPMKTTPAKNSVTPSKTTPLKATPTKNGVKRKHSDTGNGEITPSKKVILWGIGINFYTFRVEITSSSFLKRQSYKVLSWQCNHLYRPFNIVHEIMAGPYFRSQSKPMCKYGAECYQTNTTHLEQFDHPPKV